MLDLPLRSKVFDETPLISSEELTALLYRSEEPCAQNASMRLDEETDSINSDLVDDLMNILIRIKSQRVSVETQAMQSIQACIEQLAVLPGSVAQTR